MKFPFRILIYLLPFLLLAQTCNKEIPLPNSELKKIFGKWEWVETSGGFTGKITTPAKASYTEEIEFMKDGSFLRFKNGNMTDKNKFTISEGKSIFKSESTYIISFSPIDSSAAASMQKQSLSFMGNDTLFLKEECHDCFSHVYVIKK
jgi:hypothetical protein